MRSLSLFLSLLAFALPLGNAGAVNSNSAGEPTKVRSLLVYQTGLFNQAQWNALYRTYTPRVRSRCPYRRFVREMNGLRALIGGRIGLRNVVVRVTGRRAAATYQFVARGKVVSAMTAKHPDIFVRIRERWLDDLDSGSPC
jgi:hypothetical protein